MRKDPPWLMDSSWINGMLAVGGGILLCLAERDRRAYKKLYKQVYGHDLVEMPWYHYIPWALRDELCFGWANRWASEVNGAMYFTLCSPEQRARWLRLAAKYNEKQRTWPTLFSFDGLKEIIQQARPL